MRRLLLKTLKWTTYPLWRPLLFFPAFRALAVHSRVDLLVGKGEIEKACELREQWLTRIPYKHTAPLWRSQGDYLLYNKNDYENSLEAYKKAIGALDLGPANAGVTDPMRLYYGSAVAAVLVGSLDEAEKYLNEFLPVHTYFSQDPKTQKYATRYAEGLKWLRRHIYGDGTRRHLKLVPNPHVEGVP